MLHILDDIMNPKIRSKHVIKYNFIQNQPDGISCAITKNKTFNGIRRGRNRDLSIGESPLFYAIYCFHSHYHLACVSYIYIYIYLY